MPAPRTITLNGIQYAIHTEPYRHTSRRTMRDSAAIAGEPSDSLFDTQGAWARYRHSWHEGQGQQLDDLGDENISPFRYRVAENLDVWQNGALKLQAGWERVDQLEAATGTAAAIAYANGVVMVSNGRLTWYDDAPFEAFTQVSGINGARQIATDGVDFYLAGGAAGLFRIQSSNYGAASLFGPVQNCDNVSFAGNRLLIGDGASLYEVGSTGARTLIRTHFQSTFRWNVVFAIGSRIYVGGFAGTRGELYSLATDTNGVLVLSSEAAPLEPSEYVLNAQAYAGFVILLTNLGARFAQVGADGTLTYGPRISAGYGGATQRGLAVGGGYAWFTQTPKPEGPAGIPDARPLTPVQVELDLTTFIDTLKPAHVQVNRHASLFHTYEALVYVDDTGLTKQVVGLDRGSSMIGKYGFGDEDAISGSRSGYVETGLIRFGTVENKVLTDLEVGFDALPANCSVTAAVYAEDGTLLGTNTQSIDGSRTLSVDLGNTVNRACYVRITLTSTVKNVTPTVRFWRIRAYPVVPPVQEWVVPIIAHETVIMGEGEGMEVAQDPFAIRNALETLWKAKAAVEYVEGDASYTVRVEDFEVIPAGWRSDGKYYNATITLRLVSVGGVEVSNVPPPPPPPPVDPPVDPDPEPGGETDATTARFFYGGTGIFHTLISASNVQVHPRSATIVNTLANGTNDRGLTVEGYAMSVIDVDPAGDEYQVIIRNDSIYAGAWGGSGQWGFNNITFLYPTIRIQPGAQLPSGTDASLIIRDWANDRALSFWVAEIDEVNKRILAHWGGAFPANSDGNSIAPNYSPGPYGVNEATINRTTGAGAVYGHTAVGISGYQGVLTFDDLERGYIDHALVFATRMIAGPPQSPGTAFYYPATTNDGSAYGPDRIEAGSRIQLTMSDSAIDAIWHPGQRMIARALKDYGAFVVDYAGAMATFVAQRPHVGNTYEQGLFTAYGFNVSGDGWNPLNAINWSQMQVLIPA